MGFTLLFYCTVFNANDTFYDLRMATNDLNMINLQSHISLQTTILEKLFNMCLPATLITLRRRCLNCLMHASISY